MTKTEAESQRINVNRTSIDSLDVFDVTEDELQQLEDGSPTSTILNFAIGSGSIGVSMLASLLTMETSSLRVFTTLLVFCVLGVFCSFVLIVVWVKLNKSRNKIFSRIRERSDNQTAPSEDPTST